MNVDVNVIQLHLKQKQPNLKLKTLPKQLLGSLPLAFVLPTRSIRKSQDGIVGQISNHCVTCNHLPWQCWRRSQTRVPIQRQSWFHQQKPRQPQTERAGRLGSHSLKKGIFF